MRNHITNNLNHLSKEGEYGTPIAETAGFCQNYVLGHPIHVHFCWWPLERPADHKQFCARFHLLCEGDLSSGVADDDASGAESLVEDENGAVLIDVVELLEDPQGVTGRAAGISLIWLRPSTAASSAFPINRSSTPWLILQSARKSIAFSQIGKLRCLASVSDKVRVRLASAYRNGQGSI